jgi:hypothetical protein
MYDRAATPLSDRILVAGGGGGGSHKHGGDGGGTTGKKGKGRGGDSGRGGGSGALGAGGTGVRTAAIPPKAKVMAEAAGAAITEAAVVVAPNLADPHTRAGAAVAGGRTPSRVLRA